ncbi:hypothetical protein IFR05_009017 [Cadophora sp. M221]|nr:hypothetical protein IFR05_009017 [Cadophora sp. M221]
MAPWVKLPAAKLEASFTSFGIPLKSIVGEGKIEFYMPEDFVCEVLEFFRAACHQDWESDQSNTVILEEDPKLFMLFATWVTRGSISNYAEFLRVNLAGVLVLGGMLLALGFKNAVMEVLVSASRSLVSEHSKVSGTRPSSLEYLHSKTEPHSPIRILILDLTIMHLNIKKSKKELLRSYYGALRDFCKELAIHAIRYVQSNISQAGLRPVVPSDADSSRYCEYPEEREISAKKDK